MKDWKTLKPGDPVIMKSNDFDGIATISGLITEVCADHAIMRSEDGITLWIDNDTADMFRRK